LSIKRIAVYATLCGWTIICLLPLYWVALASLKAEDAIIHGPTYFPFIDFSPTFEAWHFILRDAHENLLQPLWNSLVISLFATLVATASATLMLYSITRLRTNSPGINRLLIWGVLASRALTPVCLVIPLYMMAHVAGLLDTQAALIITYSAINLPVAVWLLLPIIGPRAAEFEESAMLEGAGPLYVLWHILLPTLAKGLATVALIVFVLSWNEYLYAVYLTTNHASTLTPWMVGQLSLKEAQIGGEPEEWAHLSAATVLMVTPLLIFSGVVARFLTAHARAQ
jgi:multiple sugar transport system permease protein